MSRGESEREHTVSIVTQFHFIGAVVLLTTVFSGSLVLYFVGLHLLEYVLTIILIISGVLLLSAAVTLKRLLSRARDRLF